MKDGNSAKDEAREEFLTARQLAAVLQVSESTVRRLAREGLIPSVRLTSRLIRFNPKAVYKALDGSPRPRQSHRNEEDKARDDGQLSFPDIL